MLESIRTSETSVHFHTSANQMTVIFISQDQSLRRLYKAENDRWRWREVQLGEGSGNRGKQKCISCTFLNEGYSLLTSPEGILKCSKNARNSKYQIEILSQNIFFPRPVNFKTNRLVNLIKKCTYTFRTEGYTAFLRYFEFTSVSTNVLCNIENSVK
jgi:hypothetical protein